MDGDRRRQEIIKILGNAAKPISGTELARELGVSRQVIVQDIALLRAVNKNIMSTNKGYLVYKEKEQESKCRRIIKVCHGDDEIREELYAIVDLGGGIRDVVVEHPIYGQISVDLLINSRQDADNFVKQVELSKTKPLNDLTKGIHYHTIVADNIKILDSIERELFRSGFIVQ